MIRKNIYTKCLSALYLMAIASSVFATSDPYYFSVKGGYSNLSDFGEAQTVSLPQIGDNKLTRKYTIKSNAGFNMGVAFGKNFDMFRVEGEIHYTRIKITDIQVKRTFKKERPGIFMGNMEIVNSEEKLKFPVNVNAVNIGINGYYDIKMDARFRPYVGIGVGSAIIHRKKDKKEAGDPSMNIRTVPSFQAMFGSKYYFTKNISMMLEYRFSLARNFPIADVREGEKTAGFKDYKANALTHSVNLGATYTIV